MRRSHNSGLIYAAAIHTGKESRPTHRSFPNIATHRHDSLMQFVRAYTNSPPLQNRSTENVTPFSFVMTPAWVAPVRCYGRTSRVKVAGSNLRLPVLVDRQVGDWTA